MLAGSIKNYKFGTKNNWRRRVWNEFAQRVPDRKNALVIYLSGAQDLDRRIAIEKGFRGHNLVCVDKSPFVVKALRSEKKLAIQGDLSGVLWNWPSDWKVSVVHADLCNGISEPLLDELVPAFVCRRIFEKHCAVAFNLQRGRETGHCAKVGRILKSAAEDVLQDCVEKGMDPRFYSWVQDAKRHRCVMLLEFLMIYFLHSRNLDWKTVPETIKVQIVKELHHSDYLTYRSGVTMDSVVYSWNESVHASDEQDTASLGFPQFQDLAIRRQIAAIRAVRTMRINNRLH